MAFINVMMPIYLWHNRMGDGSKICDDCLFEKTIKVMMGTHFWLFSPLLVLFPLTIFNDDIADIMFLAWSSVSMAAPYLAYPIVSIMMLLSILLWDDANTLGRNEVMIHWVAYSYLGILVANF